MSVPIPPELRAQLGTGQIPGLDAQGRQGLVPDDLGTGQKTFESLYNNSRGDLGTLEAKGGQAVDAFNALADPYASSAAKVSALLVLNGLIVSTVLVVAPHVVTGIALAAIVSSVTIVGAAVAVMLAVLLVVVAIVGDASASAPTQDTDAQKLALAINQIPSDLPLPSQVTPPGLRTIQIMGLLSDILTAESKGESTQSASLALSQVLDNNTGFANDIYGIAADVLLNPRWRLGQAKSFGFISEEQMRRGIAQGSRMFGYTTYEDALNSFRGTTTSPEKALSHFQSIQTSDPQIKQSTATGVAVSKLPEVQRAQRTPWKIPRYFPLESPNYDPYDVARYVIIFSVLYSFSDPRQARAATYAALYLVLVQKAWAYKAGKAPVPEELYSTMGFLLDMVCQYPFVRNKTAVSTLNAISREPIEIKRPLFKDVDWYVKRYLALAPAFVQELPPTSPEAQGGATTSPGEGKPPFMTVPGSGTPSRVPMIGRGRGRSRG